MMVSLFDQFTSPIFFGIPLIALAITLPLVFFPKPSPRWLNNRLLTFQGWFVNQFTKDVLLPINAPGHKWALLFVGLVIFLMTMNILGLFPYTYTPTAQLSLNLGLAVPLWLGTVLVGLRNQPNHSLAHLLPEGTPTLLIPVLIVIETISLCIRPLALGVRLTANITAGHLLIHLIGLATYGLATIMPAVAILTFALLVMLTLLEVAVALIQAYVFVLLLSLYLQENT